MLYFIPYFFLRQGSDFTYLYSFTIDINTAMKVAHI